MHVLVSAVSSAKYPSGICRHAANLASSLVATPEVPQVTLFVGAWQYSYFQSAFNLQRTNINVIPVAIANNAFARNVWYHRSLPRIARGYAADIVQLSFPAPISRRSFGCPVVCSLHDLYPYDIPENFGSARVAFNRLFLKRCLAQSDFVVCSSDFTLGRLRFYAPVMSARKVARIYPSLSVDRNYSHEPEDPQLCRRPFLLSVAQHRSNKNLKLLLDAMAALYQQDERFKELRLLLVGAEGPETKTLHGVVGRHSMQERVLFRSALPDAELCWLYSNCELLVIPSQIEGFCLPLAEAIQCGSRILCSDIPVLREVGGQTSRYFPLSVADPIAELANAIAAALHEPKPQPYLANRFAPNEIVKRYIALYRKLLAGTLDVSISISRDTGVVPPETYAV
jgi:glycosyltransferase involved in cell wall biosynthesis